MVKWVACPECSDGSTNYLMLPQEEREYDEKLEMPITVYVHNVCKTQLRITGLVCIDCGGTGQCEGERIVTSWEHGHQDTKTIKIIQECPHCDGLGIIPRKFTIIPGDGTKPNRLTHTSLESSVIDDGIATAAENNARLFPRRRGGGGRRRGYVGNW